MENSESGDASGRWFIKFLVVVFLCFIFVGIVNELATLEAELAKPPTLAPNFTRVEIEIKEKPRSQCTYDTSTKKFDCGWTAYQEYNLTCARESVWNMFDCIYPNGTVRSIPLAQPTAPRPSSFIQCKRTELAEGGSIVWPSTCFLCVDAECHPKSVAEIGDMSFRQMHKHMFWNYVQSATIWGAIITFVLYTLS